MQAVLYHLIRPLDGKKGKEVCVGTNSPTDVGTLQVGPPREVCWGTDRHTRDKNCLSALDSRANKRGSPPQKGDWHFDTQLLPGSIDALNLRRAMRELGICGMAQDDWQEAFTRDQFVPMRCRVWSNSYSIHFPGSYSVDSLRYFTYFTMLFLSLCFGVYFNLR